MTEQIDPEEDKPLDPATEKVRRKLARFGAIFMGLNMLALMAVLGAIVYKIGGFGDEATGTQEVGRDIPAIQGLADEMTIDIPDGAETVSVSISGSGLAILLVFPDGNRELHVHDPITGDLRSRIKLR